MGPLHILATLCVGAFGTAALAATTVPTDAQQPGTQPGELSGLESPTKCDNCHAGYDSAVEPATNWRASMMSQATRDPLFWAAMTIAEQDFDGAGDFCLRCHTPDGWISGRSTPTDGSALNENDAHGVSCDLCHSLTNPDGSEHSGLQTEPFVANDGSVGWLGSSMIVLYADGSSTKLGPYDDAEARHKSMPSSFHRGVDLCGTCHDISNPVVGDLSPGHGTQSGTFDGTFSGVPGGPLTEKIAFNNAPYTYGIVERTFSEYKAGLLSQTLVSDYESLPSELQDGAIQRAYEDAVATGTDGDYVDGTDRYFSCQTCHMRPVQGYGANKRGIPFRDDLPLHDLTGANTWVPDAIEYLDGLDALVIGGGLDAGALAALEVGESRCAENLSLAAGMSLSGDTLTIVNLTGHKLISGYPEGRRMWLDVAWYDVDGTELRHDGEYGTLTVSLDGSSLEVESILDLEDPYLSIFEAHYGMTQKWAETLVDLGWDASMALSYDRETAEPGPTLGDLAASTAGDWEHSYHFALNDFVVSDTRIPPYGLDYDDAKVRNILPVPEEQYGDPGPGGTYEHKAEITLVPPTGATYATIELKFQPTSWEYIQFLSLANDGSISHLADTGDDLMSAWLATDMAAPTTLASLEWGTPPAGISEADCDNGMDDDGDGATDCDDDDCTDDAACASTSSCGNGTCEAGEDCESCAADCDGKTSGKPSSRWCCGNGVAEPAEGDGGECDGNY